MDTETLMKFIQEPGYKSLEDIRSNFPGEDPEVLDAVLTNLTSRNKLKKVPYQGSNGKGFLFCVPA